MSFVVHMSVHRETTQQEVLYCLLYYMQWLRGEKCPWLTIAQPIFLILSSPLSPFMQRSTIQLEFQCWATSKVFHEMKQFFSHPVLFRGNIKSLSVLHHRRLSIHFQDQQPILGQCTGKLVIQMRRTFEKTCKKVCKKTTILPVSSHFGVALGMVMLVCLSVGPPHHSHDIQTFIQKIFHFMAPRRCIV